MIVVSDTTPLHYLILIEAIPALPAIFGGVYVPSAVIGELLHERAPEAVRTWATSPPEWLTVQEPLHTVPSKLGVGEAAAISLALELMADRILIDDRDGSREATRNGLNVVGTLGILEEAGKRGLIDIREMVKELRQTNFRANEALYQAVIERVEEQGRDERFRAHEEDPPTPGGDSH